MLLADMGARVIKIEQPGRGDDTRGWGPPFVDGESAYFLSINRNKESLTLDLKHPAAGAILDCAARDAPTCWSRTSGRARWSGWGSTTRRSRASHPRLIYCSISGFGQTGPRRARAGLRRGHAGEGGLMSITGDADGPPFRLGVAIADIVTGMFAAQGIALALLARVRTGRGQLVDVGMLDATAALLTYQAGIYFATGDAAGPHGQSASDDRALRDVRGIGRRFRDRGRQRRSVADGSAPHRRGDTAATTIRDQSRARVDYDELRPLLVERLRTRTRSEWVRI